jgi:hypothetical protein
MWGRGWEAARQHSPKDFDVRDVQAKVDSIDRFRWEEYMAAFANCDLQEVDDFLPQFLHETREYSRWIQARPMDLMDCSWDGGPIEILFVDVANTWKLVNRVFEVFVRIWWQDARESSYAVFAIPMLTACR